MHTTIFETPVIHILLRWISVVCLRLMGWKVEGTAPAASKFVLIAAPHTSNWDFPVTLMVCAVLRLRIYWMGKASLFTGPLGPVMRWLGGIAVDRSKAGNLVQETIEAFSRSEQLAVIVPPEGTRNKVTHWKTGFYYIALGAQVPIALAFLDFGRKVGGIGRMFEPSGDIEADMVVIRQFYAGITGKNPRQFDAGPVVPKD
ncbi:lysophospholipid acyltransferase family protein [Actimicrobium sp. CCC2.4]|uniref:lysophospholipid acyltransferase family protein n=1 Tax=Actimicrobium sp. CCC2.4 TaxID=3048606 RepID=UPI002AC98BB8|nr:lysophospholipid acyltransferase family protein [Actimicrobium sp. CCC2.4]MEB0135097.1 lysophospholipid acyltransferase family protein [Actimicrobium sp. CCC2.4]WPX31856.1 lysophospholipid acyltransferase family protein [Actimicrobium sp. CCC2.4]